jgi:hypothetical protein
MRSKAMANNAWASMDNTCGKRWNEHYVRSICLVPTPVPHSKHKTGTTSKLTGIFREAWRKVSGRRTRNCRQNKWTSISVTSLSTSFSFQSSISIAARCRQLGQWQYPSQSPAEISDTKKLNTTDRQQTKKITQNGRPLRNTRDNTSSPAVMISSQWFKWRTGGKSQASPFLSFPLLTATDNTPRHRRPSLQTFEWSIEAKIFSIRLTIVKRSTWNAPSQCSKLIIQRALEQEGVKKNYCAQVSIRQAVWNRKGINRPLELQIHGFNRRKAGMI